MDRSSPCQSDATLHLLQGLDGEWHKSSLSCGFVADSYHMTVSGMIQIIIKMVTIVLASFIMSTYVCTHLLVHI